MTIAEVRPARASVSARARAASFSSRPGLLERLLAVMALSFLAMGLPSEWTSAPSPTAIIASDSGGPIVIVVFMGLVGSVLIFALKQVSVLGNLLLVEPPLYLLSLLILFSFIWSEDPATSIRRAIALMLTTLLGIYFVTRFNLDEILFMVSMVFLLAIVVNWAFVLALPQYGLSFDGTNYIGITSNRNVLGALMVLGCILMQFLMGRRHWRLVGLVGWAGAFGLVLGTESKTSLVSLLLLNGLWLVFSTFRSRQTLFGAALVSEATAAVFGLLFATANLPLITDLLDRDITLTGRTFLWADLLEPIGDRFWLGYGWDGFWGGYLSPAHEVWIANNWTPPTAHNAFLEYMLLIGFVGTALWTLMAVRALLRSIHYLREHEGAPGMLPILIISYMMLFSITEAGVIHRGLDWMLVVVAVVETKRFMKTRPANLKSPTHLLVKRGRPTQISGKNSS